MNCENWCRYNLVHVQQMWNLGWKRWRVYLYKIWRIMLVWMRCWGRFGCYRCVAEELDDDDDDDDNNVFICTRYEESCQYGWDFEADLASIGTDKCTYCNSCLLYTSPSPRDCIVSRMPSSAWKKFFLMIRRPPRSTPQQSSAASDVYKRQGEEGVN